MLSNEIMDMTICPLNQTDATELIDFLKENGVIWLSGRKVENPNSGGTRIIDIIGKRAICFSTSNHITLADCKEDTLSWQEFKQIYNIGAEPVRLSDYIM